MRTFRWAILMCGLLVGGTLALAGDPAAIGRIAIGTPPMAREDGTFVLARSELYYSDPISRGREKIDPPRRDVMRVGLEVLVDGQPLPTVWHQSRLYLPVPRLGLEYEIRVWNDGPRRIAAVVSIDGLSVINSRPASELHPGYLVEPSSSIRIKGWRRDRDTVAAFRFVDRKDSYASRLGHFENVGVIGVIAVEEMARWPRPLLLEKKIAGEPSLSRSPPVGGIGTESGRDVDSPVDYVPFIRGINRQTITLYYDTAAALRRAGVPVEEPQPVPFPGDREK